MDSSLLKTISDTNSPSLLFLIGGVIFLLFFKEFVNALIKLRKLNVVKYSTFNSIDNDRGEEGSEVKSNIFNKINQNPTNIVDSNFIILEKYYNQSLEEYKLNSRFSLVISVLGFIIIVIGISFALSNQISIGLVSSSAGIITEAVSFLFYKQNKILSDQVIEFHKKLVSTQYLLTAISLTNSKKDDTGEAQKDIIINNILYLANELHGAKSEHLFNITKLFVKPV